VLDTKKKTKFEPKEKPALPEIPDIRKQREHENRFNNRRPPHDQRTKPSPSVSVSAPPVQNVDPMERSLRDINLRLKNAERDQEKERRRIKETIATPPQKRNDFNKPRERNEGFRRNDRPRQEYAQQRFSEPPLRPVRDERPSVPFSEPKEISTPPLPTISAVSAQPVAPPPPPIKPVVKSADPVFEMEVSNSVDKENLQHGRKTMVKRRILKAEDEQTESPGKDIDKPLDTASLPEIILSQATPESSQEAKPGVETITALESKDSEDTGSDAPISFGR
jgi:hypothetical protein